jgi:hypothetical protein
MINLHAVRHHQGQQQQPAPHYADVSTAVQQGVHCAAGQGHKKQCVAAGEAPQQQQCQQHYLQQQHFSQQSLQQLQQQPHVSQQPQQQVAQQMQVLQQQQQIQQVMPGSFAQLAAAAAAVSAPVLQGPCLRLQQLLQYALALLYAVMQPLQAALAQGAATAHAAAAGVEQQLQQVLLLLEHLMQQLQQQLHSLIQQGYQTVEAAVAAVTAAAVSPLHELALQAGLQLVQLCALLLNDTAAGAAVGAQLAANAAAFAADAVACLAQSLQCAGAGMLVIGTSASSVQSGEAGVLLQQLKAAHQHMQLLLANTHHVC